MTVLRAHTPDASPLTISSHKADVCKDAAPLPPHPSPAVEATIDAMQRAAKAAFDPSQIATAVTPETPAEAFPQASPKTTPQSSSQPSSPLSSQSSQSSTGSSPASPHGSSPKPPAPQPAPQWYTNVVRSAWDLAVGAGASALGSVTGLWHWVRQHAADGESRDEQNNGDGATVRAAVRAGANGGQAPKPDAPMPWGPLWEVFTWLEESQDTQRYGAWLRLNGYQAADGAAADGAATAGAAAKSTENTMQTVAHEIAEARRDLMPVVLQDHNVPLLHPFAHSEAEIFATYLDHMAKDTCYGSSPEARALAEALGVRIEVYQPVEHVGSAATSEHGDSYGAEDATFTLHIRHNGSNHWEGVARPEGTPPGQPLTSADIILRTPGDGNCLFHAIARSLQSEDLKPRGRSAWKYDELRSMAIRHMRNNPAEHQPHVRLEVNVARSKLQGQAEDNIDARAIRFVTRAHTTQPWDATLDYLASQIDDVMTYTGASTPERTAQAMDRLVIDLLRRLHRARTDQGLTAQAFLERAEHIATSHGRSISSFLSAFSTRQRAALLECFEPRAGMSLEEAETNYGPLLSTLALRHRTQWLGAPEISKLLARELRDPQQQADALDTLVDELDATRFETQAKHPMTPQQWAAVSQDPNLLQATRATLIDLANRPQNRPVTKLRALYRLVNQAPQPMQQAFWTSLLRDAPHVYARVGQAFNQRIQVRTLRDVREVSANQEAINTLFECMTKPTAAAVVPAAAAAPAPPKAAPQHEKMA